MDFALVRSFSRRRWRWLLIAAAAVISGYGSYKLYHRPSVSAKRRKISKFLAAIFSLAEAVSTSMETAALVSSDLHRFITSDSDEIPLSIKQISKIAASDELHASLARVSEAFAAGIGRGLSSGSGVGPGFSDRALDKLFSASGTGFASVVVGSFARSLVLAFYSGDRTAIISGSDSSTKWVDVLCGDDCRGLIADSIQRFVSTAVTVYLDKTMEINTCDDICAALTNPKHEAKVKDFFVSVCNGAVETLVKTSHQVLTNSDSNSRYLASSENCRKSSFNGKGKESDRWVDKVSTTLAVPSNKKFVLDLTGRVTFETVRSFLDFATKSMCDGARRSVGVVREETVERGSEVVRYVSAKSMVIYTICLALCMHLLTRTRLLMPA